MKGLDAICDIDVELEKINAKNLFYANFVEALTSFKIYLLLLALFSCSFFYFFNPTTQKDIMFFFISGTSLSVLSMLLSFLSLEFGYIILLYKKHTKRDFESRL